MGKIGILANFLAESSGAGTPESRPGGYSKSFIPRAILLKGNHAVANHLETAAFMGHIHIDPKNHR
jgi:hypothetical protein